MAFQYIKKMFNLIQLNTTLTGHFSINTLEKYKYSINMISGGSGR